MVKKFDTKKPDVGQNDVVLTILGDLLPESTGMVKVECGETGTQDVVAPKAMHKNWFKFHFNLRESSCKIIGNWFKDDHI